MFSSYIPLTDIQVFLVAFLVSLYGIHLLVPLVFKRFPPGPWGWPIVGCLPSFMGGEPHRVLANMGEKYGSVFSLRLGTELVVVVNGYKAIREALVKKGEFCNSRPSMPIMERTTKQLGIVSASYGRAWKEQRKFTLTVLRRLGMGRSIIQDRVVDECSHLNTEIRKLEGHPIDPTHLLTNAISNIISSIIFGKRFEYDDPVFKRLLYLCNRNFELTGSVAVSNFFPILQYIPVGPMREIVDNFELYRQFLEEKIDERRINFDPSDICDIVTAYLHEIYDREHRGEDIGSFDAGNLFAVVSDLFAAGTETASTTLRWAMLYLATHNAVQEKMHREIIQEVGPNRLPSLDDRRNLHYTEAVIQEIQRISR